MLRVLQYDGDSDAVSEVSIDEMDFHKLKWLDCYGPNKEEVEEVRKIINIPENEFDRCIDEDERPSVTKLEHFSLIIFKSPFKSEKHSSTTSFSMLISNNLLVTFRRRELEGLSSIWNLEEKSRKKVFKKGTSYIAYQISEKIMDDYFKILDDIEKDINIIEKDVFHNPDKKTVMKIFSLRKTLVYFHKSLSTNRDVVSSIDKEYAEKIDPSQIKNFRYVYDDIVQLIDMVATYRDILTSSLDIYLSSVSNNLNIIMKRMTALGSLVLVPTFITGLYGMNFRFMPEITWKYGYIFAWLLIIGSIIFLFSYFKKKDWF
ncbi:MAG: magnesium/cobalt transporter CorA [Nanoarchaeota archaeon]|nr:magnesium/cobalt transporter CorA [DPANN group archaeon]MBL7116958.1 magnesium/cobalt transporter CorA [Nanoarchaeota archaeon]